MIEVYGSSETGGVGWRDDPETREAVETLNGVLAEVGGAADVDRSRGVGAFCADGDLRTRPGGQHQKLHDGVRLHLFSVLGQGDARVELSGLGDEFGRGARVQASLIANRDGFRTGHEALSRMREATAI